MSLKLIATSISMNQLSPMSPEDYKKRLKWRAKWAAIGAILLFMVSLLPLQFKVRNPIFIPCDKDIAACANTYDRKAFGFPYSFYVEDSYKGDVFHRYTDNTAAVINFAIVGVAALFTVYLAEYINFSRRSGKNSKQS